MSEQIIDIAVVGGGLAGGLTALAVHRAHPELRLRLFEAGDVLGGNHRWSWFSSDLGDDGNALLASFRKTEWSGGNEVRFPEYRRKLGANYNSLASRDFDAALRRELPQDAIFTSRRVESLREDGVTLANGETIPARTVIDCRDFMPSAHVAGGWQVFMGRHIRLPEPHRLERPVIMDASVEQLDGYRFVYVLPLGAHELFVEDTYYNDTPELDRSALSRRIDEYCSKHGWDGEILGGETGVLPVITGGDCRAHRSEAGEPGVVLAGARGLFTHPLTSYTVPIAVANALAIAQEARLPGPQLAAMVDARARRHWRDTRYYRLLGRMLFQAARPAERYRIFQRFYRLRQPLIERFYAARSTRLDKLRILSGKPPVPVLRAIPALLGKAPPLVQGPPR